MVGGIAKIPTGAPEQTDHILRIALDGLRYRPGAWARRVGPASARRFGPASAAVTKNVEWSRPRGEQLTFDAI